MCKQLLVRFLCGCTVADPMAVAQCSTAQKTDEKCRAISGEEVDTQPTKCKPHVKDGTLPIKVYAKGDPDLYPKDAVSA